MSIDKLDEQVRLPYDEQALLSGDPKRMEDYMRQLVKTLQQLHERIVQVANLSVDLSDGSALYLGLKDSTGDYPNGTWRFIKVGTNLELQKKMSGSWAQVHVSEEPQV